MRRTSTIGLVFLALFISTATLAAVPEALHFSGRLDTGGTGLTGTVSVVFTLYTDPTSPDSDVWTDTQTLSATDGRFHTELTGVTNTMLAGGALFLGVQVESEPEMSPRIALRSVPYARQADNALTLDGKLVGEFAGVDHAHARFNVATVSATGGDYTGLKAAVDDVATWCSGATAGNRCLIRLMPGNYALDEQLTIPANMDIVGQGQANTVISRASGSISYDFAGALKMSDETSLRNLTIKRPVNGQWEATGLYIESARVRLDQVTIDVTEPATDVFTSSPIRKGIEVNGASHLVINESSIIVSTVPVYSQWATIVGLKFVAAAGSSLDVRRSVIKVSGDGLLHNKTAISTNRKTTLTDVTVEMSGAGIGVRASQEITTIIDSEVSCDGYAFTTATESVVSDNQIRVLSSRISGGIANVYEQLLAAHVACVDSYNSVNDVLLAADCSDSSPVTQLTESDVEGYITNGAINLATGSQVNGVAISTGAHTTDTQLTNSEVKAAAIAEGFVTGAHTTDTQLSDAQVLSIVANGGYVGGAHTTDTDTTYTAGSGLDLVSGEFSVATDSLDFSEFKDTMSLDTSTTITLGSANLLFNMSGTGDVYYRDGNTTHARFYDSGDVQLGNGSEIYVDTSTNRVGILDSTPSYTLDVNGTLRTTGAANFTTATTSDYRSSGAYEKTWSARLSGRGSQAGDDFFWLATLKPNSYDNSGLHIWACAAVRHHGNACGYYMVYIGRYYNPPIQNEEARVTRVSFTGDVGTVPDILLSWAGGLQGDRGLIVWARNGKANDREYVNASFKFTWLGTGTLTKGTLAITDGANIEEFSAETN